MSNFPRLRHVLRQHWLRGTVLAGIAGTFIASTDIHTIAYHRDALAHGQWWRVFTGQFAHLGLTHAAMNAAGFALTSVGFRHETSPQEELLALTASMIAVAVGLWWFSPQIHWYVGLSGAIYGVLVHHVLVASRNTPRMAALILGGIAAKILYEQFWAPPDRLTEHLIGGTVAIDAHLYGALAGLPLGLMGLAARQRRLSLSSARQPQTPSANTE